MGKMHNTILRISAILLLAAASALFSACTQNTEVERLLQKANSEWIKGHNHGAIEIFKSVLERHPTGAYAEEALFRLGEVYHFGLNEPSQAIAYFLEVLQLNKQGPFSYDAQKYIAELVEFSVKDLDQAVIEYQKLINDYNRSPEEEAGWQYRIASIFSKKQNYEQAIVELKILLDKYPGATIAEEAHYRIAETLFTLNRCEEVRPIYQSFKNAHAISTFAPEMDFILASCLEENGELKESLNLFQTLIGRYAYPPLLEMKIDSLKHRMKKAL